MTLGRLEGLREGGGALHLARNQLTGAFPSWLLSAVALVNGTTLQLQVYTPLLGSS